MLCVPIELLGGPDDLPVHVYGLTHLLQLQWRVPGLDFTPVMAPSRREKTKSDLDEAIFRFENKRDELNDYFEENEAEGPAVRRFNIGVVEATLQELASKWEALGNFYMNFTKCRDGSEPSDEQELSDYKEIFKNNRKNFTSARKKVNDSIDIQRVADEQVVGDEGRPAAIEEARQNTLHQRELIHQEVGVLVTSIGGLPQQLSADSVNHHRLTLDNMLSSLESRLQSTLEEQVRMEPANRINFYGDHRTFVTDIKTRLFTARTLLFSKQKETEANNLTNNSSIPNPRSLLLEKLKVPHYDGDPTKWLLFKDKFRDLVAQASYDDSAQGHVLRDVVPKEAQNRIEHLKLASEMFVILDQMYGDTATSVGIIVNKLLHLKLTKTTEYDKIIELTTTVDKYSSILNSLSPEAIRHVKYNTNLLAHLVSLLPRAYEDKWFDNRVSEGVEEGGEWQAFTNWLKEMERRANAQRLSKMNQSNWRADPCAKCRSHNHSTAEHPDRPARVQAHGTAVSSAGGTATTCPICLVHHERGGQRTNIILDCPKWRELSTIDEKARLVESMKGCKRCLRWDHQAGEECKGEKAFYMVRERLNKFGNYTCGKLLPSGQRCLKDHSSYLCGSTVQYCCLTQLSFNPEDSSSDPASGNPVLLPIQLIKVGDQSALAFYDSGCTAPLCTYDLANRLGLPGSYVSYSMKTVDSGGWIAKYGKVYSIPIETNDGEIVTVSAYGVDEIAECHANIVVDQSLKSLVPEIPEEAWNRPRGKVDLLLGSNLTKIMPRDNYEIDNLRVLSTRFGSGFCLQGTSSGITRGSQESSYSVQVGDTTFAEGVLGAQVQTMHIKINYPTQSSELTCCKCEVRCIPFLEAEEEGILPPRRCTRCKNCLTCSDRNQMHTELENAQLAIIESKIHIDGKTQKTYVEYPFIEDPSVLGTKDVNNRSQAIGIQRSVENRLRKKGLINKYNEEFSKLIARGTLDEVSAEELSQWEGGVNYVSHHEVEKASSSSTPCRIVSNSALLNKVSGKSLNQILMKGPNCLNNMIEVLIRFRSYKVALIYDLKKAYNSLFSGPMEKYVRLLVWRECDQSRNWKTYGFTRVTYGDLPASCQLECTKDKCAELGAHIDSEAAEKLKNDCYVDDGLTGGSDEEVQRLRGELQEDGSYNGTLAQILQIGGLQIKAMMVSGEENILAKEQLGDYILGIQYDSVSDKFIFPAEIQVFPKKRGIRTGPTITGQNISELDHVKFTPRILVGLVNSLFDPIGLMSPWYLRFKLLLRQLTELPVRLQWDDLINEEMSQRWRELIIRTIYMGPVTFR